TTTKEKAAAEVMRLEKVKEAWARQALNWEIASQNNKEANAESSIQFARLARVYEIASEEAYQAERIWNALKDKKEASSTDMKKTCVTLLGESIEFTKKSSFERSEELFKQADNAWKEIKKQTIGGKIAQAADHATSVLQYVNIFGIISPAAFSQIISLSANAMNNQEVATIVANTLEGSARKYYAKIARIEARESTSEVFKNRMKDLENNLKFLKLEKERIDKKNQDEEAIDREIERAEIRLNAHREACDVFWPTETPIKIGEGISSFSLNQPSSSSSSNNNIISSQDVSESTPQPTGRFQVAVGYKGDRADKDVVLMQRAQEKIETAAITRAEFIKFVRDDAQQRDDDAAELDAL
ncbi:MAG TPA: hypothetical protein VJK54_03230, partial [Chthoniobacterales bacterium]|nr:hypothetical protein [Chthoniobacterales bacterium]